MPGFVPSALAPSSCAVQPRAGLGMGQAMDHQCQLRRLRRGHVLPCAHPQSHGAFPGCIPGEGVNRCPPGRAANRAELPWVAPEPSSTVPPRWDCDAGLLSWPWQGVRCSALQARSCLAQPCHAGTGGYESMAVCSAMAPRSSPHRGTHRPSYAPRGLSPPVPAGTAAPMGPQRLGEPLQPAHFKARDCEARVSRSLGPGTLLLPVPLHWQPPLPCPNCSHGARACVWRGEAGSGPCWGGRGPGAEAGCASPS